MEWARPFFSRGYTQRMAGLGESAFMAAAPEVGIPLEVAKQAAPHLPTLVMVPLVMFAILFIIIGIIVVSAAQNKTPGVLLLVLGFLLGGGAFFVMYRTESAKHKTS